MEFNIALVLSLLKNIYSRSSMAQPSLEPWKYVFKTVVVPANECYSLGQVMGHNRDIFLIFFKMKVYCVFSLESPHWGDSNENTQYTIFNIKKKITKIIPNLQLWDFFKGLKNKFQIAMVNMPSVFKPLKFYCRFHKFDYVHLPLIRSVSCTRNQL